jgi:hypothetical protein
VEPPGREPSATRVVVVRAAGDPALASALGPGVRETVFGEARALSLQTLPTDASCADLDCAEQFLATGAADLAVLVELTGAGGVCERVSVTVVSSEGTRFSGAANVPSSGVPDAARTALRQAIARSRGEAMPTLSVDGTPPGASIFVDGVAWGGLPHEEPIAPGEHRLEVRARGHAAERREVTVGSDDLRLRFDLAAVEEGSGSDATPLWVSGAGALALGIAGVLVGTLGFAMGETCTDATCATYSRPDVGASAAWLATGGALVIGGSVLMGLAASTGGTSGSQARLTLATRF